MWMYHQVYFSFFPFHDNFILYFKIPSPQWAHFMADMNIRPLHMIECTYRPCQTHHLHRNVRLQSDKSINHTNKAHDGCWEQHPCVETCQTLKRVTFGWWHCFPHWHPNFMHCAMSLSLTGWLEYSHSL